MTGLNQRLRHSPGETQSEVSRGTLEAAFESDSGVRDIPRLLPLLDEMHALCQCGAIAIMPMYTVRIQYRIAVLPFFANIT